MFMNDILTGNDEHWHLFLMDIDDFKKVNDTKGHTVGDAAIKLVADSISDVVGEYRHGFVSRWGGDEFVAIMQDGRDVFTAELKDRIETRIAERSKETEIDFPLHLSIGHARHIPRKTTTLKELIESADKELYAAKKQKAAA